MLPNLVLSSLFHVDRHWITSHYSVVRDVVSVIILTEKEQIEALIRHVLMMRMLSSGAMQQPKRRTRFLCWSFAISKISFLNSSKPCPDVFESLFRATSSPFSNFPCLK